MKIHATIVVLFTLSFFYPSFVSAQWVSASAPSGGNYESIYFFDSNNGVASSEYSVIKTSDGGATWTTASSTQGIRDIDFNSTTLGYAAGVSSTALKKTTDGGNTWTALTPVNSNSLWGVSVTTSNVYVCGTGGVVWKSTNGGASFTAVNLPTVDDLAVDLAFTDDNTGCVLDQTGIVYKTTNGGATWNATYTSSSGFLNLTSIYFVDANNGYATGWHGTVLKTTDGGDSWTALSTPTNTSLQYVHFADVNNGMAVGDTGTVIITHNGGTTWEKQTIGTVDLYSCYMLSANSAVAGAPGKMYINTNLSATSGINSVSNFPVNICPVPFNSSFVIRVPSYSQPLNFELYSVTGRLVISKTVTEAESVIDGTKLSPESYFYILKKENEVICSGKIIKAD